MFFFIYIYHIVLLLGNILCLCVFNQKSVDLKPSFSNILKCLSIYDICTLVRGGSNYIDILNYIQSGVLILYGLPSLSPSFSLSMKAHTTPIILPLTQVALTGSVYSVIMVATERYFNICKPFHQTRVAAKLFTVLKY